MKVSSEYIKKLLLVLGYKETNFGIYNKKYKNNYTISINFEKEKIFYIDNNFDKNIKLGDGTTSNFENSENFVVLECVDRLLEKGYSPDSITLEKKWEMGRKEKGKLDILVSKDNVSYLMIECKTWGSEFNKEYKNMLDKDKKGGQLFSYYNQDRNAEYLCLYTSRLNDNDEIEYKNEIVKIDEELKTLANVQEIHNRWNKQFSFNGIFEKDILPYGIQAKALLKKDLEIITPEDGKNICGSVISKAISYAVGVLEVNASMGLIVAAPTAGSSGVMPGTMCALQEEFGFTDEEIIQALFNASAIGYLITRNATTAGAEGGCQAEVGSASAMAASAVTELMGGTIEQCFDAASFALINLLGLVCDPVGGLVEFPCQLRNAQGATTALTSAEMALSGIKCPAPLDENIEIRYRVGKSIPSELRETSLGGMATSKGACSHCNMCH